MIWRYAPLAGTLLFLAIVACWRPWLQFRRYGSFGIWLFRSETLGQKLRDGSIILLFVLMLGQAVAAAGWPQSLSPLSTGPTRELSQAIGAILLFGGIGFLVAAQLELGASWRIGIEEGAKPGLVTSGLYRFCRNPIFLAMLIVLAGYALLLPTLLSFALLVGAYVGIRQQTSAEEAYLLRTYGEAYRDYARRVGRFVPGLGKFRSPRRAGRRQPFICAPRRIADSAGPTASPH